MLVEIWPIDRPKDYPNNARRWSAHAVEKVAASIREYGWRQPVVVDGNDVIVIGHLRRAAGKFLGLTEVPVHVARDLTPAQIRGLRLADIAMAEVAGGKDAGEHPSQIAVPRVSPSKANSHP